MRAIQNDSWIGDVYELLRNRFRPFRRFGLVLIIAICGCASQAPVKVPPPVNKDWTITIGFNYDFTNYPICSASITKGCIIGFTWGYNQGSTAIPLKTSATSICTGSTQPVTCTDTANSTLGIGSMTAYAVANAIDNNGNPVSSGSSAPSAPVNIAVGIPTNVTWSTK